jgi:hypothetical protein
MAPTVRTATLGATVSLRTGELSIAGSCGTSLVALAAASVGSLYDIGLFVPDPPAASAMVFQFVVRRAISFPVNLAGSLGNADRVAHSRCPHQEGIRGRPRPRRDPRSLPCPSAAACGSPGRQGQIRCCLLFSLPARRDGENVALDARLPEFSLPRRTDVGLETAATAAHDRPGPLSPNACALKLHKPTPSSPQSACAADEGSGIARGPCLRRIGSMMELFWNHPCR